MQNAFIHHFSRHPLLHHRRRRRHLLNRCLLPHHRCRRRHCQLSTHNRLETNLAHEPQACSRLTRDLFLFAVNAISILEQTFRIACTYLSETRSTSHEHI